jgi:hypothetical protein
VTTEHAVDPSAGSRPPSSPREVPARLRLQGQPQHRSRGRPHPGQVRVGQEGPAAALDRGLRHRQVHLLIARHRGCDIRLPCRVDAGHQARQRTGRAADEKTLSKTIARYGRVDLLCIDELGYMQLDRRGAELLSQILTEREEKAPSRSRPTSPSPAGPGPSLTRGSAPPPSTDSPSAAPPAKPAPTPTGSLSLDPPKSTCGVRRLRWSEPLLAT